MTNKTNFPLTFGGGFFKLYLMKSVMYNPWHGCHKKSEGCQNCYMFSFDKQRGIDSNVFHLNNGFDLLVRKKRDGSYKLESGSHVMVCLTSDFFLEEADLYRDKVWQMILQRQDVKFEVITKRIERVLLPENFKERYQNFYLNVTVENQKRADERIPLLLALDLDWRGLVVSPMLEPINIEKYLQTGKISHVAVGGENYKNARELRFEWVKDLAMQCKRHGVDFEFYDTGSNFVKDGKRFHIPHNLGKIQAYKAQKEFLL